MQEQSARSTGMHAVQAVKNVLCVLKYLKRAAQALRGATEGGRNTPQLSKDFQNGAVRGCVTERFQFCFLFLVHRVVYD